MTAFCFPNVMQALQEVWKNSKVHMHQASPEVGVYIGSVFTLECLDAPAILATFTAGRTGLVACP